MSKNLPVGARFRTLTIPRACWQQLCLADGVKKDELSALDVDRVFRKLEEIRSDVTLWWEKGDQSVQGFRNEDYALGQIWLTRANAMKNDGLSIG